MPGGGGLDPLQRRRVTAYSRTPYGESLLQLQANTCSVARRSVNLHVLAAGGLSPPRPVALQASRRHGLQLHSPMENPYCSCNLTRRATAYSCAPLWRVPTAAVS